LRTHHIRLFYEFLESHGLSGTKDITAKVISEYALSMKGGSQVYAKHRLATLRFFFKYLYKNRLSEQDFSVFVPSVRVLQNLNVPALWEKSEIELLLKSIDRGSPAGKRDYAVILLAVQLGLRIHDIANLRLNCLRWELKQLDFIQRKTGNRTIHHLLGDVGWAIIDYIQYARPKVKEDYIFLTVNAPYTKFVPGSVGAILTRHMRRCGIKKLPGTVSGMHSLRHALARRLLEQGTSLQGVADFMGHSKYSSTLPYLKSEIEGMRECALSLKGVTLNAK
jgi:site-specific recombinase XerD